MSLQSKQFYDFANFHLDVSEKVLLRDGVPVPLAPKVFDTLCILTENAGQLIEKDELMRKIWSDRFVEEGNLAFNIKVLRKALGDDAAHPRFIETVPRRGYRFIAKVNKTFAAIKAPASENTDSLTKSDFSARQSKSFRIPLAVGAGFLLVVVALGVWIVRSQFFSVTAPVLSAPFASEKLSTNGKVFHAVFSPDGKNMVYTNGGGNEKQSVWLRQLETGNNVEIIAPSDNIYGGLAFSPDGNFLYFSRKMRNPEGPLNIYRIPIFGGIPQKIVGETVSGMSVSPGGEKISFVRCYYRDDEYCSLWIADSSNGANERKIAARPRPFRISDNKFSPDGRRIAFATGQSENAGNEFALMEIDLESGTEREFSKERFFNIKSLAWLPDESGLLVAASRIPNRNFRIWQVSAATGEAVPLTNDSETYGTLSLDKEATKIVSTRIEEDFRLRVFSAENPSQNTILANAEMVAYAPDGKIYFSSVMSGNSEIWSIKADGTGQKQLTNDAADDSAPIVAPDNGTVYFVSNRTGAAHVWRMNTDGSNQTQITQKEGGFPLFVSPDGEWVYYHHGITRTLWRVSARTGEEQLVLNKSKSYRFAISPDGTQIAYSERQGDERILTVASLLGGQTLKTFQLADRKSYLLDIVWMPDGKSAAYISASRDYTNNILWLQPLDKESPCQIAPIGDDQINESSGSLTVSPDGKTFAVTQGRWLHDAVLLKGLR
jgi:Tol biopolymer transport system component/DNA-binding winged helix-turn-helix (wHTH) protein